MYEGYNMMQKHLSDDSIVDNYDKYLYYLSIDLEEDMDEPSD